MQLSLVMDPDGTRYFAPTRDALVRAAGGALPLEVVPTDRIGDPGALVARSAGVVIGPGSPYRDEEGALAVIRSARARGVPLVGT